MAGGVLEVFNSSFINNTAYSYGGAIVCLPDLLISPVVRIKNTVFTNDISLNNAGGGIYLKNATFNASNLTFRNCKSETGSAITLLTTNSLLDSINAFNNSARYDGGAVYAFYGDFSLKNSISLSDISRILLIYPIIEP